MAWWDDPDLHPDDNNQAPAKPTSMWDSFKQNILEPAARSVSTMGNNPMYRDQAALATALAHVPADVAGFVGDLATEGGKFVTNVASHGMQGPQSSDLTNVHLPGFGSASKGAQAATDAVVPRIPASSPAAQAAVDVGEGIASMFPGAGEVSIPRLAASGAGMVAGSKIAEHYFPGSELAQFVGGFLGGTGPHAIEHGVRSTKTAYSIRRGASMPGYQDVNNVIVNDLEGGGTLEHPKVSPKGATGPQQVMMATARKPGFGIRPWDGKTQSDLARVGRQYSAALMDRYEGDPAKVLAAYNGGFNRVDKAVRTAGENWLSKMPKETRDYVRNGMDKLVPTGPERMGESSIVQGEQPDIYEQSFANHMLAPFEEDTPDKFANQFGEDLPKFAMADNEGISPDTPEFDKKYGYDHPPISDEEATSYKNAMDNEEDIHFEDDPYSDYVYDDEAPDEYSAFDEPQPHYDYIGSALPYDQYAVNTGKTLSLPEKKAIENVAHQHGVHPWDMAEAILNKDDSVGVDVDKATKDYSQALKFITKEDVAKDPYQASTQTEDFYAPYSLGSGKEIYTSIKNYENKTGKKIGPLTKQAINEYAELVDKHPSSVASHFLSETGNPQIKEDVASYRDQLAKEQMTKKEYKAFQKLPTTNPKILKILSKYLGTSEPPKTPSALAKFGKNFVAMLKDNRGGTIISPEEMHQIITDWNEGTHYLMKGPDGTPLRIYHGTKNHYEGMPSGEMNRMPKGYVLYSTNPDFANEYAKLYPHDNYDQAARVFPAYIKNDTAIGDFRKPEDLAKALQWYKSKYGEDLRWGTEHDLAAGDWGMWEKPEMLKDLGWKGVFMTEGMMYGGRAVNVMLEDHLAKSTLDPETYQNKSLAHKVFNAFVAMLKDDSGSLNGTGKDKSGYEGLDPEEKLQKALKSAQPVSAEQRRLQSAAKAEKAGFIDKLQQEKEGLAGFKKQAAALKGELPKSDFNSIAEHFSEDDINHLLNKVNASHLLPFEKFRAQTALLKLLGAEGAKVPTANEIKLLSGVLHEQTIKAMLNNRPLMERFWRGVGNAINIPRTIMASFDLSAPFRQGLGLIHKKAFWTSFAQMFKQFGSEKAFQAVQDSIKTHPNYPLMRKAGLALADTGHLLMDREEQFMSDWAEKIPVAGKGIHMSNRAYVGFLNKLRADTFNQLIEQGRNLGYNFDHDTKALKDIANFVNTATGRGSLGRFAQAGPFLNSIFFAPRLIASRFNTLFNPMYYMKAEPFVRREQMKSFISMGIAATTVLSLAKASGASVSMDPQSPDFLKIKIGHTRLDVLGGYQQYMRLFSQLVKWSYKMEQGHKPKFGERTAGDDIVTFLRNKLNPTVSFGADFFYGKDATGKKFNAKDETISRFIPLFIQDFTDAYKDSGIKGAALAAPGLFGVGVQTYEKRKPKVRQSTRNWWEDPALTFPAQGKEFKQ